MATKSILKNITIKNKSDCKNLLNALNNADNKINKDVDNSKNFTEILGNDIVKMFGDKNS